jgi:tetratricopeptide (TPR) repeat protein/V8-like Glu-specific endopeptidase
MSMIGRHRLFVVLLALSLATPPGIVFAQDNSVEQLFQQGNAAGMAGNHVRAEEIFRKILQIDPNHVGVRQNLGHALMNQEKFDQAVISFQYAIKLNPKDPAGYFFLGNALSSQQKFDDAISAYQQAIKLNPNHANTYTNLGNVLSEQQKFNQAITAYRNAIKLNPRDPAGYFFLGNALSSQQKFDDAVSAYQQAIKLNPNHADTYNKLGDALRMRQRFDEAIAVYQKSIQLNPNSPTAYHALGIVLFKQGKFKEAISAYQQSVKLDSNYIAYYNMGIALEKQGKLNEAITAYQQSIRLNPNYAAVYNNLGVLLRKQGKLNEAITAYQQSIKLNPNSLAAYNNIGAALRDQGKFDEAITALHEITKLYNIPEWNPQTYPYDKPYTNIFSTAYNNLGLVFQRQSKLKEAINQFDIAASLDPNFDFAMSNNIEARRLLIEQENRLSQVTDDLQWLPQNDPNLAIKRSVVRVITEFSTNERPGTEFGTGIVIQRQGNRTLILTARHVIFDSNKQSKNIQVEFFSSPPPNRVRMRRSASPLKIISNDEKLDLVVLEITDSLPNDIQPLPMSSTATNTINLPVRIIGHSANRSEDLSWTVVSGRIISTDLQTLTISQANVKPGYSGGPVLDSQNRLLGIIVETRKDKQQDFAMPVSVIKNQLSIWNISSNP